MSQDKHAIVIDNGSYQCKAGMAEEKEPKFCFHSCVGRPKFEQSRWNMGEKEICVGDGVLEKRAVLSIKWPIEFGIIVNFDDMERVWLHAFNKLGVYPEDHPVLLTETVKNPKANREKITQIYFETFNVPQFLVVNQGYLSLMASGRSTGIVLDSGYSVSNIVPVFESSTLLDDTLKTDLAGRACDRKMASIAEELGDVSQKWTEKRNEEIARDIKEELCYVALDYEEEMEKYKNSDGQSRYFQLPDGSEVKIVDQRFRCPEILFNPLLQNSKNLGLDSIGIPQKIYNSINKCDIDIRRDLYENILLAGGNTLIPGFKERLEKELASLAPSTIKIKVDAPNNRKLTCFIGGSIMASLSSNQTKWITSSEYEEYGPTIVHRKLFDI